LGDLGHGGLGEEAAVLQLSLLLLLLQLAAHQSHNRSVIEGPHHLQGDQVFPMDIA
jgi:hypothetical protein